MLKLKRSFRIAVICGIAAALPLHGADSVTNAWQPVTVPGAVPFTGLGWYRAWIKVPDSYFTRHERNLFEESVGVYIRDLAGAHEAWLNGRRIGTGSRGPMVERLQGLYGDLVRDDVAGRRAP